MRISARPMAVFADFTVMRALRWIAAAAVLAAVAAPGAAGAAGGGGYDGIWNGDGSPRGRGFAVMDGVDGLNDQAFGKKYFLMLSPSVLNSTRVPRS